MGMFKVSTILMGDSEEDLAGFQKFLKTTPNECLVGAYRAE